MPEIANKIEHYGRRAKELVEQAIMTDRRPLNGKDKGEERTFEEFLKLSKGEKFLEAIYILKDRLPEEFFTKHDFKKYFYNSKELPFSADKFSFEGIKDSGSTSQVYLFKSLQPQERTSWALKVLKDEYVSDNFENLNQAGKFFSQEYKEIKGWYGDELSDLFLPEYIVKLKSPKNKKSMAILQPYQGKEMKDIFIEIPKEKLINLLETNQELKNKFIGFIKKTINHAKETGEVIDLIGRKNVSLVDREKLIILDPHWIHSTDENKDDSADITQERLSYLKSILSSVKEK